MNDPNTPSYHKAMGRLLVLYTQIDNMIMRACADRIAGAPDENARLGLAKQVGDESRHVTIQREWMHKFGSDPTPVISAAQEQAILAYFRSLDWPDFLADMYLCVEALGSDAVEKIVPLADPGTKESLRVPLQDEIDHIAFGVYQLKTELARMTPAARSAFLDRIPGRIADLTQRFHAMGLDMRDMFEAVGTDYDGLCRSLSARKKEMLHEVSRPLAA